MDIKISKAREKDFPYILGKIEKYLLDSTNIHWRQFFVARIKDSVISFGRIIDHGDFFEIASLGVDYYHRKKGIGAKLLNFLVQEAKRRGFRKPIYGVTHVEQFVSTCGFIPIEDNYPAYLDFKRKHICQLDESRLRVMKWCGSSSA